MIRLKNQNLLKAHESDLLSFDEANSNRLTASVGKVCLISGANNVVNHVQLRPRQFETEKCLLPHGGNVPDPFVTDPIIDYDTRWHVASSDATPVVQDNAVPVWHSKRQLIMVSGIVQDKD
ncbi:hypothetical protein T02_4265 [Trichinella nativa]|uniref:Uncharacterized protein n=1 Tax=Trichinella nativa TaxID=6335 RepID=A0A0V1L9T5_9BILA|nr:hypothetical protein T02_4265 [Trichinella nativa]